MALNLNTLALLDVCSPTAGRPSQLGPRGRDGCEPVQSLLSREPSELGNDPCFVFNNAQAEPKGR